MYTLTDFAARSSISWPDALERVQDVGHRWQKGFGDLTEWRESDKRGELARGVPRRAATPKNRRWHILSV